MSRGRKPNQTVKNDWESIFLNSVGSYVQMINTLLSKEINPEPLSNYIKIIGGYAFKSSNYTTKGVPVIRISDFNNEQIILDGVKYYQEDENLSRYELNSGDIIIALTGGTIAKLAIVQDGLGKLYLNQRVGKFEVLDKETFKAEYIYWIARSVQTIIKNLAWGAAIPNVSAKQIEKLEFPIPNKVIQKGIVEFLNDLKDNKVNSNRVYFNSKIEEQIILMHLNQINGTHLSMELTHQLSLVTQIRQSFLREAMQGKLVKQNPADEPASELLARIKAEKEQLIKEKKIRKQKPLPPIEEEEIPFEIPEGWVWCRLGNIADIKRGKSPKYAENGIFKMLNQKCVRWFYIETEHSKAINKEWYNNLDASLIIQIDDLLVNSTGDGTIGRSAIAGIESLDYTFDSHVLRVRGYIDINHKLLSSIINSKYGQDLIESIKGATSTKQTELGVKNLSNFPIPIPPNSEQKRIVAKLDELMTYCDQLEKSIRNSQAQNELLLKQVLTEALGLKIEKAKPQKKTSIKQQITSKFDTNTTLMEIVELLKRHGKLHAEELWKMSKFYGSKEEDRKIDEFYAELKKQIELNSIVKESTEKGYLELV